MKRLNLKLDASQQREDSSVEFMSDGNEQTPLPRSSGKRKIDGADACSPFNDCGTQHSITHNSKMMAIKKEPCD